MFETELTVKHAPKDQVHEFTCPVIFFTTQVMPNMLVFFTHAHSVTCDGDPSFTSDTDLLYASLIHGTLLYSSDSEGGNVPVAVDDPQVFHTKTRWSL